MARFWPAAPPRRPDGKPPVDTNGRPLIRKLGTFDTTRFVENSLVMFKGTLYSFRWMGNENLIEYKGKVIIRYCTGDQATTPHGLAEATYEGSEPQFLRGWFPETPPQNVKSTSQAK